jgi:hypothetical protein
MSVSAVHNWTVSHEALLRKWADYCRLRSIMHQRTSSVYEWGHYVIGPLTIASSSVAAITQFANVGTNSCDSNGSWNSFDIAVIVFVLLSSVFSGLQTFFRFDKTSTQHRSACTKYELLQHDIEEQLSLNESDRTPVIEFIRSSKAELNALSALNLSIPTYVINHYMRDVDAVLNTTTATAVPPCNTGTRAITEVKATIEDDYQDEYAEAIRSKLQQRQEKIIEYQLNRLNTNNP